MHVIPSIDLQQGHCVRLKKGCFDQVTYYKDDPIDVAKHYQKSGASFLHIVDLDGAKNESMAQIESIIRLRKSIDIPILQVGGGIRNRAIIKRLIEAGIQRVVIGSLAVTQPDFMAKLVEEFGVDKFVLAFDVKIQPDNMPIVVIRGWRSHSNSTLWDMLDLYQSLGVQEILCTDVEKDGMLSGPNTDLYARCVQRYPNLHFQASGGVHCVNDLKLLARSGVSATIVGRALLEKKLSLSEVLHISYDTC